MGRNRQGLKCPQCGWYTDATSTQKCPHCDEDLITEDEYYDDFGAEGREEED